MKAFLSHSSLDKGIVNDVASLMRAGTYELDSETFDKGLVNSEAILRALARTDLFCLFLSKASVRSPYVQFETLLGNEFLARGNISRFLAVCLDDESFSQASSNVRLYNIVRKELTAESIARLIQGHLVGISQRATDFAHPFVGRGQELLEIDRQISDQQRPQAKALYLSGNEGTGRRTLARKYYEDHFPSVGRVFAEINIEAFDGREELYRNMLGALRPTMSLSELRVRAAAFTVTDAKGQRDLLAQLLNSLLSSNEAGFLLDQGGILSDDASFSPEISEIIDRLGTHPHPPVVFISRRAIPFHRRRTQNDVVHVRVEALDWDTSRRLISSLLKREMIAISDSNLDELTKLAEGHPYNVYQLLREIKEHGVAVFLANPSRYIEWRHRQSSEYLNKVTLSELDVSILAILNIIPLVDFSSLAVALAVDIEPLSDSVRRLADLHILDTDSDRLYVAPALRTAVEKDKRIYLPSARQTKVLSILADSLALRLEDGTAPVPLVNASVLADLQSGRPVSAFTASYLLPSHNVWLAKLHYDQQNWSACIRFGKEAIKNISRLSENGVVAACRYVCLAAARIDEEETFHGAIRKLEQYATTNYARSNIAYLKGFRLRMRGQFPAAEGYFQNAYDLSPNNSSALRELAAISLARGKFEPAEDLARRAHSYAQRNPFLVDMLLSVLIRKGPPDPARLAEVNDLFDVLRQVGEEEGRSFYTTRKAEFEYLWGNNKEAIVLIESAVKKTPRIFEPKRLQVKIYLKDHNKVKAKQVLDEMKRMVDAWSTTDRRTNYRAYLETLAEYFMAVGQFEDAKGQYGDELVFAPEERQRAIKEIETVQAYSRKR